MCFKVDMNWLLLLIVFYKSKVEDFCKSTVKLKIWISQICGCGCLQFLYSVICCTAFVVEMSCTLIDNFSHSHVTFLFLEHKRRYIMKCPAFWPFSKNAFLLAISAQ